MNILCAIYSNNYMYYNIVDRRFEIMCSTNNDVSCDETSFDVETQEQKCEK